MGVLETTLHMSFAFEVHVWFGFRRAQTTLQVQVPLEEQLGASKVDVQVQSQGHLIFGKTLSELCVTRRRHRGCQR